MIEDNEELLRREFLKKVGVVGLLALMGSVSFDSEGSTFNNPCVNINYKYCPYRKHPDKMLCKGCEYFELKDLSEYKKTYP